MFFFSPAALSLVVLKNVAKNVQHGASNFVIIVSQLYILWWEQTLATQVSSKAVPLSKGEPEN